MFSDFCCLRDRDLEYHGDELVVEDVAVTVYVGLVYELLHLLLRQLLPELRQDVRQVDDRDEAVALAVKHAECVTNLVLDVLVVEVLGSAANLTIGEVVQSRRRPQLGHYANQTARPL